MSILTSIVRNTEHALIITGFVMAMMLLLEYVNVMTRGRADAALSRSPRGQIALGTLLGALPGCLGAYATVSLFIHRVLSLGALVATMIATSGDEAFVMLALFPRQAMLLFGLLAVIGLATGLLVDLLSPGRRFSSVERPLRYRSHHDGEPRCVCFSFAEFLAQWRACKPHRGLLTLMLLLFLGGVLSGRTGHQHLSGDAMLEPPAQLEHLHDHASEHEHTAEDGEEIQHEEAHADDPAPAIASDPHDHAAHAESWSWVRISLLLAGLIALFIVASVPDHFLEEHLWNHLVRVHVWRIFLWTLGALLVVEVALPSLHLDGIIQQQPYMVLLLACLFGLIPQSGPHLVFVSLFASGAIPFTTLLASCIVQDGHGMIPLLAHSRRDFIVVKLINLAVGLSIGVVGLLLR